MDALSIIRTHWEMIDCLYDEVFLGKIAGGIHNREALDELFRFYVCYDERFNAIGFTRHPKGYMQYTNPEGKTYRAEAAVSAFLGLDVKSIAQTFMANQSALRVIYRGFEDPVACRVWLRWHVQKMFGYSNKTRDLWKEYPRVFPDIQIEINYINAKRNQDYGTTEHVGA